MDKYRFFNEIIDDESFVKYLAVLIKSDLLMGSFEDDLRILSNKIQAQYNYKFVFKQIKKLINYKSYNNLMNIIIMLL